MNNDNDQLMQAVANLIKVKGRHHTEQAYKQLVEAYDAARTATYPADTAAYALNTILWLYRRLPRGYGRPPAVERSINALAAKTGTEVAAFLEERDDSHTTNSAAHQEGVNLATQGREG